MIPPDCPGTVDGRFALPVLKCVNEAMTILPKRVMGKKAVRGL